MNTLKKIKQFLAPTLFLVFLFSVNTFFAAPAFQHGMAEVVDSQQQIEKHDKVDIISTGMNFKVPKEIPSGWTNFSYNNKSPDTHFFVLEKMPEGKNINNLRSEIIPIFASAMKLINSGQAEQGFAEFDRLPTWYFDVKFTGGAGLISPGGIAETSVDLEPGVYVMECYVKMPDGQFHSALGMIEEIKVTETISENEEPHATRELTISQFEGIEFEDSFDPGEHIFAVHFKDQTVHENFVGHDVHLVRLDENSDLGELADWIDWTGPEAFKSPAPEGVEFLGGTQEMPAGKTSYFTATLTPGRYAFVSEVSNPDSKNMLVPFDVPEIEITKIKQ